MEQELRETILEDCKRLMRESKKLIKQSREIFRSAHANELSEVFGETQTERAKPPAAHPAKNPVLSPLERPSLLACEPLLFETDACLSSIG